MHTSRPFFKGMVQAMTWNKTRLKKGLIDFVVLLLERKKYLYPNLTTIITP